MVYFFFFYISVAQNNVIFWVTETASVDSVQLLVVLRQKSEYLALIIKTFLYKVKYSY